MIFLGLVLIALAIAFWAVTQKSFHVKPRAALMQVTVAGSTEESEQMHMVLTLFTDESPEEQSAKLRAAFELREIRLKFQNERMIALREAAILAGKEAQEEADRLGIPSKITPITQKK